MSPTSIGAGFADAVLDWSQANLRDLPWRHTRDPWRVLLAEVMSQQTQLARVIPRYLQFVERWPDPPSMAQASLAEVLSAWEGMGYPRRARWLWETARLVRDLHDGVVPSDPAALVALPGVGRYTASAVRCFAYGLPVGVVDTNVARVLARVGGRRLSEREVWSTAESMVPSDAPWRYNSALLDLGATLCRPKPRCDECPLRTACVFAAMGAETTRDPASSSARVSTAQAPFAGSDRQLRGRVLRRLGRGPATRDELVQTLEGSASSGRAGAVIDSLVGDGLIAAPEAADRCRYRLGT